MSRYVLFAYVDGFDLHDVATEIERRLQEFLETTRWTLDRPWLVNDRTEDDPSLTPGDLPTWNLGLNVKLPDTASAPPRSAGAFPRTPRNNATAEAQRTTAAEKRETGSGQTWNPDAVPSAPRPPHRPATRSTAGRPIGA